MNRKQKDKKQKLNSNPDSDDQIYAAEKLLAKKIEGKKTFYLVKWKGWDNVSDNSWEPEGNILDKNLIKEFEERNESTKKTNKKNLTRLKKPIKKTANDNNKKSKANKTTIKKDEIDETTNNSTSSDDTIENIDLNESQSDDRNKKSYKNELDSKNDDNKIESIESVKNSKEDFIVEIESSGDEIENNNFSNLNKTDDNSKQDDYKKKDDFVQKSNKSTIVSVIDLFDKMKNEQTDKQETEQETKVQNDIDGIKIIELKKDEIDKINENKKLENDNKTSTITNDCDLIATKTTPNNNQSNIQSNNQLNNQSNNQSNQLPISKPKPINIQSNSTIFPNLTAHLSFNKCVQPPQIKSINSNQKLINNSSSNEKKIIGIGNQIASSFTKVQPQNSSTSSLPSTQSNKTKQTIITSTFKPIVTKPNLTNVQANLNNTSSNANVIKTTSINLQTTTTNTQTAITTATSTTNSANLNNSLPKLVNNLPKPIPIHHNNFNFIHSNSSPFTLSSTANNKTITTNTATTNNLITTKTFKPIVSPVANINPNLIKNNLTNLSSSSIKFPFIKNNTQTVKPQLTTSQTLSSTAQQTSSQNVSQNISQTVSQTVSQITTTLTKNKQQTPTTTTASISKTSLNDKEKNSKSNENDAIKLNAINKTTPQHNQLYNFKQTSTAIHQAQHKNVRRISPPPIFWQKHNNLIDQIIITDVKSDDLCITIRESKTPMDFFKQKSDKKTKKFKNLKQKNLSASNSHQ